MFGCLLCVLIALLLACRVLEGLNIWRIFSAHLDPESPPGPAVTLRYQPSSHFFLCLLSFLWYLFHMLSAGAFIMMCKCQALHGATTQDKVTGLIFGLGMPGAFNVFLALTARAMTDSQMFVTRFLRCRFLIEIAFEATALAIVLAN